MGLSTEDTLQDLLMLLSNRFHIFVFHRVAGHVMSRWWTAGSVALARKNCLDRGASAF
jgi:hypothetical protein